METTIEAADVQISDPLQNKGLERRWLWIALLPLITVYYNMSATPVFFQVSTGITEVWIYNLSFVLMAAGLFLIPHLLQRKGVLDDAQRFRMVYYVTLIAGIAVFAVFSVIVSNSTPIPFWLTLLLEYISVVAPSITAGCALHKTIKIIDIKAAALLSGLTLVCMSGIAIIHMALLGNFTEISQWAVSFNVIYALPLLISALLFFSCRESFEYYGLKQDTYFSESLFAKFIIIAVMMALLDAFSAGAYYADGDWDYYNSVLFEFIVILLPMLSAALFLFLLQKKKWLVAMVTCTLLCCFQQGLNLFFSSNEYLAFAYDALGGVMLGGPGTFLLFIPLAFCVQRRQNASAATGVVALWFISTAIAQHGTSVLWQGLSPLPNPAVVFSISIAAIAYLFYLHSEDHRVFVAKLYGLINDYEKAAAEPDATPLLTTVEMQVARKMINGDSLPVIAKSLNLTSSEASRHLTAIQSKVARAGGRESREELFTRYNLTKREREVAVHLLNGTQVKNIPDAMGVANSTVGFHSKNLYRKLGVQSRAEMFALFRETVPAAEEEEKIAEIR